MKSITSLELLEETVEYYKTHNRAFAEKNDKESFCPCVYLNSNGDKCAVGRCFTDEALEQTIERPNAKATNFIDIRTTVSCLSRIVDLSTILKPQYKDISVYVWSQIQKLHDLNMFWDNNKLTSSGEEFVNDLRIRFTEVD